MLFFSFFKTLVDHEVTVELKNDIQIRGTLKSVDQYLNIKLDDITVVEEIKYPHLVCLTSSAPDTESVDRNALRWAVETHRMRPRRR
jgi:small nuclear ribonucleoprotein (snRNP)-like protein